MHGLGRAALGVSMVAACSAGESKSGDPIAPRATAVVAHGTAVDADPPLPPGIYALPALDESLDDASLDPLKKMVGTATMIGLGDSAPASEGFSAAKSRLSRYLIEQAGFRVVAFEANRDELTSAAHFVATCDAPATVAAVDSASARDFLAWMCGFNRDHATDPVRIVGFDVNQPDADEQAIRVGVTQMAASDAPGLLSSIAVCAQTTLTFDDCRAAIDAIEMYMVDNPEEVAQRITIEARAELHIALTSYRGGRASSFYAMTDPARASDARQEAMAAVLEALTTRGDLESKVVVWADGNDLPERSDTITDVAYPGSTAMGTALRGDLGARYQPIDLIGWDVEVDAPGVGYVRAPKPSPASIETRLHALHGPFLLIDLEDDGLVPFLGAGQYELGAPATETLIPREQYRGLIYLDRSR